MTTPQVGKRKPLRIIRCASCEQAGTNHGRGLCHSCYARHQHDGTLAQFPSFKAARAEDYAWLRTQCGTTISEAAHRVGVSTRTGWRYERALRATQTVPASRGNP
jgi:hypothetical protein